MDLSEIIEFIETEELTAYHVSKATNMSEVGLIKILSGKTKRPHKNTLKVLNDFISNYSKNTEDPARQNLKIDSDFPKERNELISESALISIENWEEVKEIPAFNNMIELELAKRLLYFQEYPEKYELWKIGKWSFKEI